MDRLWFIIKHEVTAMEADGVSRIYFVGQFGTIAAVKEAWPQCSKDFSVEGHIQGLAAKKIQDRAEFRCGSVTVYDAETNKLIRSYWAVGGQMDLEIDQMGSVSWKKYPHLLEQLEILSGSKGLTVLVS